MSTKKKIWGILLLILVIGGMWAYFQILVEMLANTA